MAHVNGGIVTGSFGGSPSVLAMPHTAVTGNTLLIAAYTSSGAAITGVTDNAGNTWTLDASLGQAFYRLNEIGASVPTSINVAFGGGGSALVRAAIEEVSGLVDATVGDTVNNVATAFGRSHTVDVDTTVTDEHAFGTMSYNGGGAPNSENLVGIGGAASLHASGSAPPVLGWYAAALGAAGTKTLGFSWDSANGSGMTCNLSAVSYQPASGGSGGTEYLQSNTGSLSSVGTLANQTRKALTAAVSSAGAMLKQVARALAGSMSSSGALSTIKAALLSIAGALNSAGTLTRRANCNYTGSVASAGAISKQPRRSLSGAIASSAVLSAIKTALVSLSGSIASAGLLARVVGKSLDGALQPLGTRIKRIAIALAGSLTSAGVLVQANPSQIPQTPRSRSALVRKIERVALALKIDRSHLVGRKPRR